MIKKVFGKFKAFNMAMAMMALMFVFAMSAHAENAGLTSATTDLTEGIGDMLASALIVITVVIGVIVTVFGISWLITIAKKKMQKAT